MPRRILVLVGHPDPEPARFGRALAAAYADGARGAGHDVHVIDISTLDFPLLRTAEQFRGQPVPEGLKNAAEAIRRAEHIVFVFPLWLGTMPALLKAFLEQVMRPGLAFTYPELGGSGITKSLLRGRSARMVVTMGMPALLYRFWYFGHGVAGMRRSILNFVGISPVHQTLLGMMESASAATREKWLAKMQALGAKGT